MTRYHTTPTGDIPFTPAEEIERGTEEANYIISKKRNDVIKQITDLENLITPRLSREALLGVTDIDTKTGASAVATIAAINAQIKNLREQLKS